MKIFAIIWLAGIVVTIYAMITAKEDPNEKDNN